MSFEDLYTGVLASSKLRKENGLPRLPIYVRFFILANPVTDFSSRLMEAQKTFKDSIFLHFSLSLFRNFVTPNTSPTLNRSKQGRKQQQQTFCCNVIEHHHHHGETYSVQQHWLLFY